MDQFSVCQHCQGFGIQPGADKSVQCQRCEGFGFLAEDGSAGGDALLIVVWAGRLRLTILLELSPVAPKKPASFLDLLPPPPFPISGNGLPTAEEMKRYDEKRSKRGATNKTTKEAKPKQTREEVPTPAEIAQRAAEIRAEKGERKP